MRSIAVIPARYGSTRLPGKPLLDICGKPMICRVLERAQKVRSLADVYVATDDDRIRAVVEAFGGKVCMTSPDCASGSDRLLEVAAHVPADIYVNIQGDEPLLRPEALDALLACMQTEHPPVATLVHALTGVDAGELIKDPNLVKVVCDSQMRALYFSRAAIPYVREPGTPCTYFAHIGVYAYTREALERFGSLPPSPLERIEKLEQLRFLQAGIPIKLVQTEAFGPGVDTEADLARVRAIVAGVATPTEAALTVRPLKDLSATLRRVRLVVTDVDGVLTDGSLFYDAAGEHIKRFHAKDGLGIVLAKKRGLAIAVLSGRDSPALRRRMQDVGITVFRLGRLDKAKALQEIFEEAGCTKDEAVFLGDDVADIPAFRGCALGVAVRDAHPAALAAADIVLTTCGGKGALRELLDRLFGASEHSAAAL